MRLTDAVLRRQAEATAEMLAGGLLRLIGETGETLGETRLAETYEVGERGEHITFPPPPNLVVSARGYATHYRLYDREGRTMLAEDLAGEHQGAVLRFEDARLFERMVVEFKDNLTIELEDA